MKQIINGKQYDTEKALHIGSHQNTIDTAAPTYAKESLYRKKTGEYFLHCEGGANTRYAKMLKDHTWTSGEVIRPLDYDEARMWTEAQLDPEVYFAEFGTENADESTVVLSISLPAKIAAKGRRRAQEIGSRSLSAYIASLIDNA